MKLTAQGTPWSLARFNDGEMLAVRQASGVVARGHQEVTRSLRDHLIGALQWRADNYFIGVPCSECWPTHRRLADEYVGNYQHKTLAVVQTNRNLALMQQKFASIICIRASASDKVVWVGSPTHNVVNLPFTVDKKIIVPQVHAWRVYDTLYGKYRDLEPGSIVFLSCGPMATVLAHEWFEERRDCTFIDIGSTFEPETTGIEYRCHTGKLPSCEECN